MASKKVDSGERAVVICTAKRGVFFGYTTDSGDAIIEKTKGTLRRARMCVRWSTETHGVLGLAGIGPQKGSKVGPRVPAIALESITAVIDCSDEAAKAWEAEVWS